MLEQQTIKLTHATWTQEGGAPVDVFVYPEHIFAIFFMPAQRATAVVSTGAGHVLVLEDEQTIASLIAANNKGGK